MFLKPSPSLKLTNLVSALVPILISVVFLVSLLHSASLENQIIDESVHLSAGYSYLLTHDFRLNPEHPALLKQLAALPLVFLGPRLPTDHPSWAVSDQWKFGDVFLYENVLPADRMLFWGRLPTMLLAVFTVLLLFHGMKKRFGFRLATGLSLLLIFDPTIVAHSRYVTSDVGVTLGFLLSIFTFKEWLTTPGWRQTALLLGALLFTVLTKFSGIFVFVVLASMWGFALVQSHLGGSLRLGKEIQRMAKLLIGGVVVLFLGIWATYHFQIASVGQVYADRLETISPTLYDLRIPALSYFRGVGTVVGHSSEGHQSYLLGENSNRGGWWYYFPVAFFAKATPAMFIFSVLIFLLVLKYGFKLLATRQRLRSAIQNLRMDDFAAGAMVVLYGGAALISNINIGIRHLLPIFPFLIFLSGLLFTIQFRSRLFQKIWQPLLIGIALLSTLSAFWVYPHVLTYFSPLVGGSRNGGNIVLDSNLDWGQDLKKLKTFMDQRKIPTIAMQYFGKARVSYYGIHEVPLPTNEELFETSSLPMHAAISASILFAYRDEYRWLLDRTPTTRIGNSIYYYDLSEEVDR